MELVITGFIAFILSGIDDFSVLVMLFMIANKNKTKIFSIISGTIFMLLLVILISYLLGDLLKNYIWLLSIYLIIYSVYKIYSNRNNDSNSNDNTIKYSQNFFTLSASIYFLNASDDFSLYSTTFANLNTNINVIYFISGIIIASIVTIITAYKLSKLINSTEIIKSKLENSKIHNIPYYIMLIVGIFLFLTSIG